MAKGCGWGYHRILGELKKLRIRCISRATVCRILRDNGFDPAPKRGYGSWHAFLQRHIKTVWAADFFTKTVWTLRGPVTFYVLFFINLHTRRVHVAGMVPNPDGVWMAQQARNLSLYFSEQGEYSPTHIVRDRDTKFTQQLCAILESDGIPFRPIPPRSPNMNPYTEHWIQSIKRECPDHFIVLGVAHLRYLVQSYLDYHHRFRPHHELGNVPILTDLPPPEPLETFQLSQVRRRERLGGALTYYERRAA